jgi:NAD(P)-dependent dehydrogenase (short-subunit alcohol dehydrogenase family)
MDAKVTRILDHKKVHLPASRNLLIVGGTSSLSKYICELALKDGWSVYCTYRDSNKRFLTEELNWIYLDYEDYKSLEGALARLQKIEFGKVIYLSGKLSNLQNKESDISDIEDYFKINIATPVWFLKSFVVHNNFKDGSTFTYLSSRASDFGSNDYYYGVAKAGLENLVKSFSLLSEGNLKFKIVVSGLIEGSRMYEEMPSHIVEVHKLRSMYKLLNTNDAANLIWDITSMGHSTVNLERIVIGPEY